MLRNKVPKRILVVSPKKGPNPIGDINEKTITAIRAKVGAEKATVNLSARLS
nr:hypothetical protein [Candidatus Njordarchaeota archaeon]